MPTAGEKRSKIHSGGVHLYRPELVFQLKRQGDAELDRRCKAILTSGSIKRAHLRAFHRSKAYTDPDLTKECFVCRLYNKTDLKNKEIG